MVKFYLNRIKNGQIIVEEVPPRWKAKVDEELKKEIKEER